MVRITLESIGGMPRRPMASRHSGPEPRVTLADLDALPPRLVSQELALPLTQRQPRDVRRPAAEGADLPTVSLDNSRDVFADLLAEVKKSSQRRAADKAAEYQKTIAATQAAPPRSFGHRERLPRTTQAVQPNITGLDLAISEAMSEAAKPIEQRNPRVNAMDEDELAPLLLESFFRPREELKNAGHFEDAKSKELSPEFLANCKELLRSALPPLPKRSGGQFDARKFLSEPLLSSGAKPLPPSGRPQRSMSARGRRPVSAR